MNPPDTAETAPGNTPAEILNTALGQVLSGLLSARHESSAIPPATAARDILNQMRERDIGVSLGCLEFLDPTDLRVIIAQAVSTHLVIAPMDAAMHRPLSDEPCKRHFDDFELHPEKESR